MEINVLLRNKSKENSMQKFVFLSNNHYANQYANGEKVDKESDKIDIFRYDVLRWKYPQEIILFHQALVEEITTYLLEFNLKLEYLKVGKLILALEDLISPEELVEIKLKDTQNLKVRHCLWSYQMMKKMQKVYALSRREWLQELALLDEVNQLEHLGQIDKSEDFNKLLDLVFSLLEKQPEHENLDSIISLLENSEI